MDQYEIEVIKRRRIISNVLIWVFVLLLVILTISLGLIYGLNSNRSNSFSLTSQSFSISSSISSSVSSASSSSCIVSGIVPVTYTSPLFCSSSNQFSVSINYTLNTCTNQVNLTFPMSTIATGVFCPITSSFMALYALPNFLLPTSQQVNSITVINCNVDQNGSVTIDTSGTITITATALDFDPALGGCSMGYETFMVQYIA
jgi:hypothetical protein